MRFRLIALSATLLLGLATCAGANAVEQRVNPALECDQIKERIRHIRSRMRSGYTRAQGERMEAGLRRLRAMRRKACR